MVVNARTGTIVIGGDVRVTPTAVTHGKLTVSIQEDTAVVSEAQGAMQNANSTVAGTAATTAADTQIEVEEENAKAFVFDTGTSLSDIVDAVESSALTCDWTIVDTVGMLIFIASQDTVYVLLLRPFHSIDALWMQQ